MSNLSQSVESYIVNSTPESQSILNSLRKIILTIVPEAEEEISYRIPFYRYYGDFVGFASYKKHVSLGVGEEFISEECKAKLEKEGYVLGKGILQIQFDQAIPEQQIIEILKKKADHNKHNAINKK